jgi:BlaI family penicillinase repressor
MARPRAKELTERELEIMQVFWDHGEQSAQELRDRLDDSGRDLAYTTVATLVRILHDKGFIEQTVEERPFRFQPVRSRKSRGIWSTIC